MWRDRFIFFFYRILFATWRVRFVKHPESENLIQHKKPVLLAHWHGDELALIHLVKVLGLATMTSTSRDGASVDYIIRRLGGFTSRGSSTRGAITALKGLIRLCRDGRPTSMAVDGPRGPYHEVKPGVFELSRVCEAPVIPVGVAARPTFVFQKSWNKAFLPLPFAKVAIYFAQPLPALRRDQDPKDSELALSLARAIDNASGHAAHLLADSTTRMLAF